MTFDIWSDSGAGKSFLGVTGHFVSDCEYSKYQNVTNFFVLIYYCLGGVMNTVALDFVNFEGSHSGENIAKYVKDIIKKYGLYGKIIGLVADNAKANDVAMKEIAQALKLDSKTYPTSEEVHFRCFAHILNICCQGKGLLVVACDILK